MNLKETLLTEAERYCDTHDIALSTLASRVAKDARFFDRLKSGRGCTIAMYERFMEYMGTDEAA